MNGLVPESCKDRVRMGAGVAIGKGCRDVKQEEQAKQADNVTEYWNVRCWKV